MNKKQLLQNMKEHVYCRLGPSKIAGVGVFAIRTIPKGINPFVGAFDGNGVQFTVQELRDVDPAVLELAAHMFVRDKDTFFIPNISLNRIDIPFYVNHSKNPNMTIDKKTDIFTTLREIKKGEEVTYDYEAYCGKIPDNFSEKD